MSARPPTDAELQTSHILARKVPAMEHGFTISTVYGDFEVLAGPLADKIRTIVRDSLQRELASLEQAA